MRTLSVHNRYQIRGGEDESREAEERMLREMGHQVDVYEEDNERVESLGRIRTATRTVWSNETYQKMRRRMKSDRFDLVHVQNFFPLISPSVYYAAREMSVPVVQSLRNYRLLCPNGQFFRNGRVCEDCLGRAIPWPGVMHGCYRDSRSASGAVAAMLTVHSATRTWDNLVDVYIALTEFARRKFIEGGLPAGKIVVKPNFVHPDPGAGSGGGKYAVFLGRLSPEKGISTLLEAWKQLGEKIPLKIIGDGPMSEEVAAAAEQLGGVEYLGRKKASDAYDIIGEAMFLVLPSLWYETFGRVAIEAFAKGTPVIASDLGAMSELIEHGRTGLLFSPGDPQDLIKQVDRLLSGENRLSAMRAAARQEFELKYTAARNYEQTMRIYSRAIARTNGGG